MAATTPNPFALLLPKVLASLPGITKLPWPGPFRFLPMHAQLFVAEQVSNRLLEEQILDGDVDFLNDATLRVQVKDMGFDWAVRKKGNRLKFASGCICAETTFSGNSKEFLLLASRREDPDTLFFQRRLSIEGDTELGLQIKNLVDSVDLDEFPTVLNHALHLSADFIEALPK